MNPRLRSSCLLLGIVVLLCGIPPSASGQLVSGQLVSGDGIQLDRLALVELLERLEEASVSPAYSVEMRNRARQEAELVLARLSDGDFRPGDQVALVVEGEPELSTTLTVRPGQVLSLPVIGDVSLKGVLRSELEKQLADEIGRYIHQPGVHAESHFRIVVSGAVDRPGFHLVSAETVLSDAIMLAGPNRGARLKAVSIEREGRRIWDGAELQRALREGRTLDRMSVRAGDEIVIPEGDDTIGRVLNQALVTVPALIVAIAALTQIF